MMKKILSVVLLYFFAQAAMAAVTLPGPLVDAEWLAKHGKDVLILDVRKDVKSFTSKPQMKKDKKSGKLKLIKVGGHITGAVLVDYSKVRANRVINGQKIDHIIPEKAVFEALMQASGVNKDSKVVIVSKGETNLDMTMATRLYWQMKYFGHEQMAILNGGMADWINSKRTITNTPSKPGRGNWLATAERNEMLASSEDVANGMKDGVQLVDNRPISQYLGVYKKGYVYAKGHIPGAKSYPNELLTGPKGKASFLPVAELKELSSAMGIDVNKASITYCNSGHLASGGWFVMSELMGNSNVKLYDGSMHQWTREKRPVASMKME